MCCFDRIYQTFPNPLIFVALSNSITLLIIGLILGIDVWPSRFSPTTHCQEVPAFYLFPFGVLTAGLGWLSYVYLAQCNSFSLDNRDRRGRWRRPFGFVATGIATCLLMVISSVIAMRGWDNCTNSLIGAWRVVTFVLAIVGCLSIPSPLLYLFTRDELPCGIDAMKMRYWFGLYLFSFEMIGMWIVVLVSVVQDCGRKKYSHSDTLLQNDEIDYWEELYPGTSNTLGSGP